MASLPGLDNLTDDQLTRCVEAFVDLSTYKAWLRSQVINYVLTSEEATAALVGQHIRAKVLGNPSNDDILPEVV